MKIINVIGIDLIKMTPSVCEVDGNTFNHLSSYSHHKNAHSSKEYSCAVCHKGFKLSKTLQVHKKKAMMRLHTTVNKLKAKKKCQELSESTTEKHQKL